eukprot:295132-Chlamydomonas_euryale.AAC.4
MAGVACGNMLGYLAGLHHARFCLVVCKACRALTALCRRWRTRTWSAWKKSASSREPSASKYRAHSRCTRSIAAPAAAAPTLPLAPPSPSPEPLAVPSAVPPASASQPGASARPSAHVRIAPTCSRTYASKPTALLPYFLLRKTVQQQSPMKTSKHVLCAHARAHQP